MPDALELVRDAKASVASIATRLQHLSHDDPRLAVDLATAVIDEVASTRAAIVERAIRTLLAEHGGIAHVDVGGEPAAVDRWTSHDGSVHLHPALDPAIPVSRTELEWWEALDRLIECLPATATTIAL